MTNLTNLVPETPHYELRTITVDLDKLNYAHQKLHYSIEKGYTKIALKDLDEFVKLLGEFSQEKD